MTRYFAQNTPRAGLEHMMMSSLASRSAAADDDPQPLLLQAGGCGLPVLPALPPPILSSPHLSVYRGALKSGAIEYLDLILEYFGHIPHAGLHKRIQAVEHWSGPDQAVLHTVSVHLRSRFADRVWMMRLLAIWRRSIFSPQRSDSGNRRSPLFHTIPLISAASYPNPMDLRYRITPSFIPPDGCMT